MYPFRISYFLGAIVSLIVTVGCEGARPNGGFAAVNFQSDATLHVYATCEEGTPRCTVTGVFNPNSRPTDLYAFEVWENECFKLKDANGNPLNEGANVQKIKVEAGVSRQFTIHIYPHPDTYFPTHCPVLVSVFGDRLINDQQLFQKKGVAMVYMHRNQAGRVVFGEDKRMPRYELMESVAGKEHVRSAFQDNVLYVGLGTQQMDGMTVTVGAAVQFVPDRLPHGVQSNGLQSVVIPSAILERIADGSNKIVPLPIELATLAVGAADTRCGDYPIKVSWDGKESRRLPIKLVVDGCEGSMDDLLIIWAEPDQFNAVEISTPVVP